MFGDVPALREDSTSPLLKTLRPSVQKRPSTHRPTIPDLPNMRAELARQWATAVAVAALR